LKIAWLVEFAGEPRQFRISVADGKKGGRQCQIGYARANEIDASPSQHQPTFSLGLFDDVGYQTSLPDSGFAADQHCAWRRRAIIVFVGWRETCPYVCPLLVTANETQRGRNGGLHHLILLESHTFADKLRPAVLQAVLLRITASQYKELEDIFPCGQPPMPCERRILRRQVGK
jgi:hypothetical protein